MNHREPTRGRDIIGNPERFVRNPTNDTLDMTTKTITITLVSRSDYHILTDAPEGVSITTPPPSLKKSLGPINDIAVNFDVDVAKITGQAFAKWLIAKLGRDAIARVGDRDFNRVSKDDSTVIDAVVRQIEHKKHDDDGGEPVS
ncbi:hypothetical protein [Allorhodopirellula heiligendammensis]|uniref:Uncharacterized protein n=1 Tax=Allorhodopirellula heiligendammensis TaxID=2714739 RepID=A0A5C6B931_9BACT|nr:hypothetical protein [Allorhodopirellula heiligendammensis]TWU08583.1 hypothetical protein Poly21_55520 [Allorhodopirellula heiligendammensis]